MTIARAFPDEEYSIAKTARAPPAIRDAFFLVINVVKCGAHATSCIQISRLRDKRWTYNTTIRQGPQGKRRRGRPSTRWDDEIKKVAVSNWWQIAQDREKSLESLKSLEEAFTQSEDLA
ncbi:unnamed protein product [Arctia plantaginis]|uniref:Uncharacterized protein n=1 Tax=Arctia plantaginis TaxID=874455 RepID=A0A8S1B7T4_ARCPL|nr:unnamed protein product [Arctia plantaginis]